VRGAAALLIALVAPLAAAQSISPTLVATEPRALAPLRLGVPAVAERTIAVVPRGDGFGVLTLRDPLLPDSISDIRFIPIAADGTPDVDHAANVIRTVIAAPSAAPIAGGALLAWTNATGTFAGFVDAAGVLTPPNGTLIGRGAYEVTLTCNETRCLAVWHEIALDAMFAAVLDARGNVVRTVSGVTFPAIAVAADPAGFAAIEPNTLLRVDAVTGKPTFSVPIVPGTSATRVDFDGSDYVVFAFGAGARATKISIAGVAAPGVALPDFGLDGGRAAVMSIGEMQIVVAPNVDGTSIEAFRLKSDLTLLDPFPLQFDPFRVTTNGGTALAWNGRRFFAAWNERDALGLVPGLVAGTFIEPWLRPGTPALISVGPMRQVVPSIASSGGRRAVAWIEGSATLRLTFLGGETIDLASGPVPVSRRAIAGVDGDFLVAWSDFTNLGLSDFAPTRTVIVRRDGSVQRLELEDAASRGAPLVGATRSSWLVAGGEPLSGFVVAVAKGGAVGRPQRFSGFPNDVVSDGERFAVATQRTLVRLYDAQATSVTIAFPPVDPVGMAGAASGYLTTDGSRVARLDRDLRPIGKPLALGPTSYYATAIRDGWLVWARGTLATTIEHVNANATAVIEPPLSLAGEMIAAAMNDDGSVTAVFSMVVDVPPHGRTLALFVRDIVPKQRHAAR